MYQNPTDIDKDYASINRIIDKLRDCQINEEIPLPRVVVIGNQSAGKSSVLESIIGRDFLPKGEGAVTRVPLELKLIKSDTQSEFASFIKSAEPQRKFAPEEIMSFIESETKRLIGTQNFSMDPIVMEFRSPTVQNFSLVDLPGIMRVSKNGDDKDPKLIANMVRKYISQEQSIIVCVLPATQDKEMNAFCIDEAIQVDSQGNRTIGVNTKVDLQAEDDNLFSDYPSNPSIRPQIEIENQFSVADGLKNEQDQFLKKIQQFDFKKSDTKAFSEQMSALLMQKIKEKLPQLKEYISQKLQSYEQKLIVINKVIPENPQEKLDYICELCEIVGNSIDTNDTKTKLYTNFKVEASVFKQEIYSLLSDFLENSKLESRIIEMFKNKGISPPNFLPHEVLQSCIKENLIQISQISKIMLDNILKVCHQTINSQISKLMPDSHPLIPLITVCLQDYIEVIKNKPTLLIEDVLQAEKDLIWTQSSKLDAIKFYERQGGIKLLKPSKENESAKNVPILFSQDTSSQDKKEGLCRELFPKMQIKSQIAIYYDFIALNSEAIDQQLKTFASISDDKVQETQNSGAVSIKGSLSVDEVRNHLITTAKYIYIMGNNLSDQIPKLLYSKLIKKVEKFQTYLRSYLQNFTNLNNFHDSEDIQNEKQSLKEKIEMLKQASEFINNEINYINTQQNNNLIEIRMKE